MCTGLEILAGLGTATSVASALNKPSIPDPPAAPVLEPTPPTPTEQTAVARDNTVAVDKKTNLRRAAASMTSWLNTNKTGGMGLAGTTAPTKQTLLGGTPATLGS